MLPQHWAQRPTLGPSATPGMQAHADTPGPAATAMSAPLVLLWAITLQIVIGQCHP